MLGPVVEPGHLEGLIAVVAVVVIAELPGLRLVEQLVKMGLFYKPCFGLMAAIISRH